MILITGDSWACGEWTDGEISHGGIAHYLREHGHQVVNLGSGGGSNFESADRIKDFLANDNGFKDSVDCVIVFQTEWLRDVLSLWNLNDFHKFNYSYIELGGRTVARFYYNLSEVAMRTSIPIYIVGGCSDTIWLDAFQKEYPGVQIVCQSWMNLMHSGNHRIDQPVFNRFGSNTELLVNYAKSKLDSQNLKALLADMDALAQRDQQLSSLIEQNLFCDDHTHPNRYAHRQLFEYLLTVIPEL